VTNQDQHARCPECWIKLALRPKPYCALTSRNRPAVASTNTVSGVVSVLVTRNRTKELAALGIDVSRETTRAALPLRGSAAAGAHTSSTALSAAMRSIRDMQSTRRACAWPRPVAGRRLRSGPPACMGTAADPARGVHLERREPLTGPTGSAPGRAQEQSTASHPPARGGQLPRFIHSRIHRHYPQRDGHNPHSPSRTYLTAVRRRASWFTEGASPRTETRNHRAGERGVFSSPKPFCSGFR
jgi:hypothetical protein